MARFYGPERARALNPAVLNCCLTPRRNDLNRRFQKLLCRRANSRKRTELVIHFYRRENSVIDMLRPVRNGLSQLGRLAFTGTFVRVDFSPSPPRFRDEASERCTWAASKVSEPKRPHKCTVHKSLRSFRLCASRYKRPVAAKRTGDLRCIAASPFQDGRGFRCVPKLRTS
jgi:hypothetical protein